MTCRGLLQRLIAAGAPLSLGLGWPAVVAAQSPRQPSAEIGPLYPSILPAGVRSRFVDGVNGLRMHVLEAGFETPGRPALVLLHGFPELAYSWRRIMGSLAAAGYHVMAPDVRGYGRTSPAPVAYAADLRPFGTVNKIKDVLALASAMGYRAVAAVIGHDQGSPLAGWCALARPDVFRSVAMISAPFGGPPALPFNAVNADTIYDELAQLTPPRKHYQRYYQSAEANENLWHPPQGLQAFLRAYYHMKSADWTENDPHPLAARTAAEWAKLPRYYVMDLHKGMAEQVASAMPSAAAIVANKWLPDAELRVYTDEYARTGFQGGLNWYRSGSVDDDLALFAGRTIDVPSTFISGRKDWGTYQNPGALDRLENKLTTRYQGTHLVHGAGHWVQQEQPDALVTLLLDFLQRQG